MLTLQNITKRYPQPEGDVVALDNVSLTLRDSEFVAVLGQSGCGKTTLLNIIGGLDHYTSGDLIINGRSTREYKDADWDAYRNHSVGFVFQSYNLIPHQTVLANVEMALTIGGGLSAEKRRELATAALTSVGLGDQLHKRPAQMSGGQMQRVAIARALVNNPDIVLADEPTGALDSATSVQIMELLKEIARDRLVIMVTHNPELAEEYATRIVTLKDGTIRSDSNPPTAAELASETLGKEPSHTRLPFFAALSLSFANLLTKKGRTILTAFAGAIGIIGIALILSLSNGMNAYIAKVERETMSSYPVELEKTTVDFSSLIERSSDSQIEKNNESSGSDTLDELEADLDGATPDSDNSATGTSSGSGQQEGIISNNVVSQSLTEAEAIVKTNDLGSFRTYLMNHMTQVEPYVRAVEYTYNSSPVVWRATSATTASAVSPTTLMDTVASGFASTTVSISNNTSCTFAQLVESEVLRESQYELLAGNWPKSANEAVLIVNSKNKVSDFILYKLGLLDETRMNQIIEAISKKETVDDPVSTLSYSDALGKSYTVFSPAELYRKVDGVWIDKSSDATFMAQQIAAGAGINLTIVGVLRSNDTSTVTSGVAYTEALVQELFERSAATEVVKEQLAKPEVNVFTGEKFSTTSSSISSLDSALNNSIANAIANSAKKSSAMAGDTSMDTLGLATTSGSTLTPAFFTSAEKSRVTARDDAATGGEDGGTVGDGSGDAGTGDDASKGYTVTFVSWDDSTVEELTGIAAGTALEAPVAPERESDEEGTTYYFVGWQDSTTKAVYPPTAVLPAVTGDVTYQAFYLAVPAGMSDEKLGILASLSQEELADLVNKYQEGLLGGDGSDATGGFDFGSGDLTLDDLIAAGLIDEEALAAQYGQYVDVESTMDEYFSEYLNGLDASSLNASDVQLSNDQLTALMTKFSGDAPSTYEDALTALGYGSMNTPESIKLYPVDFGSKDEILAFLDEYNAQAGENEQIMYTDLVGSMTSSVTEIIDTITLVLVAFVSISLVVSSIMISIITYISVLERTKEIGILRALGASKRDVARIFNAETFIEGLLSGLLGVGVTLALNVPICLYVATYYEVENIAQLSPVNAVLLIAVSIVLTVIAGFIPARMASRRDPVVALRSE